MKIITHNGQFHADEVFACALLLEIIGEMPIERTRIFDAIFYTDQNIWIIDVGQILDPKLKNFDHHQDESLAASNVLVLTHLYIEEKISAGLFDRLHPIFLEISKIDREGYSETNGFQVNSLIKSFNSLPNGFEVAISTARAFIKAQITNEVAAFRSRVIFDQGKRVAHMTVVCDEFPFFWKSYGDADFLVAPTQDKTGWAVHSIDGKTLPLIRQGNEVFFHAGKFLAVYASKEEAVKSAISQAVNSFG